MNTRDKIESLIVDYQKSLSNIHDGNATVDQQKEIFSILRNISFYTTRLMLFTDNQSERSIKTIINDGGDRVIAVGAPGSIERCKIQYPYLLSSLDMLNQSGWEECMDLNNIPKCDRDSIVAVAKGQAVT